MISRGVKLMVASVVGLREMSVRSYEEITPAQLALKPDVGLGAVTLQVTLSIRDLHPLKPAENLLISGDNYIVKAPSRFQDYIVKNLS